MKLTPYHGSVHTHSAFCDGKNTMAEMAAAACAAGVKHYGFSGHIHTPAPADVGVCMNADLTAYREEGERLRSEYAGRMEILLGIEWDLCSDMPVPDWADYWIGSVHNLFDVRSGEYYTVDWKPEMLCSCRDEMFGGDMLALAEGYFAAVAEVAAEKPDILGHIDLITKLNGGGGLLDEGAARYRAAALNALHTADPAATLLEINTGAMSRGYRKNPYPDPFLLEEWRRMGGQVIITADTHSAQTILYAYDQAISLAKEAGFRESVLLTGGGWVSCPL